MTNISMTPKQRRFVDEYLIDLNATQAAIRAGYSKKTAQQIGSRLLLNVVVTAAVAVAKAERSERTKIDSDWVLKRLVSEVTADLAELYAHDGALKAIRDWPLIWRQGLVGGLDVDEQFADGRGAAYLDSLVQQLLAKPESPQHGEYGRTARRLAEAVLEALAKE